MIPAYRAWSTLPLVLDGLAPQAIGQAEVILVDSSDEPPPPGFAERWPWVDLVRLPYRALPGSARNMGMAQASGDLLVFLDADAVPNPGWLDALVAGLSPGLDCVSGSIVNGTPWSAIGSADYLLEFSHWAPHRRKPHLHAPSANLLLRREVLERVGGFPEELWPGEDTVLTFSIAAEGRLGFAPDAQVRHLGRTGFREYLAHQYTLGSGFAAVCDRVDFPRKALARPGLARLAALLRLGSLLVRSLARPRQAAAALILLPLLTVGLASWARGLALARR